EPTSTTIICKASATRHATSTRCVMSGVRLCCSLYAGRTTATFTDGAECTRKAAAGRASARHRFGAAAWKPLRQHAFAQEPEQHVRFDDVRVSDRVPGRNRHL